MQHRVCFTLSLQRCSVVVLFVALFKVNIPPKSASGLDILHLYIKTRTVAGCALLPLIIAYGASKLSEVAKFESSTGHLNHSVDNDVVCPVLNGYGDAYFPPRVELNVNLC